MNATIWRRKMREVYVGNLAMTVVNEHVLAEVFNSALGELCDDPRSAPPVVQVNMSPDMKYAFVEMRTHELSDAAMHLDGVELCGRVMKVGRPKGWTPDVAKTCAENPAAEGAAAHAAARKYAGEDVDVVSDQTVSFPLPNTQIPPKCGPNTDQPPTTHPGYRGERRDE
jgi:hypothetical protein